jgi:hypothetical protein
MKRITQREVPQAISDRRPFRAGNMTGGFVTVGSASRLGDLPPEWRAIWKDSLHRGMYVVWSYDTPIAWTAGPDTPDEHLAEQWAGHRDETRVVMPFLRYSLTTTKHQHLARLGFHVTQDWSRERRAVPVGQYGPRVGW